MRAMFTVTASALICVSLLGCNRSPQMQAPVPTPIAAAAPACNCPQQAAAVMPVAPARKHRHHHRGWGEHQSNSYSYGSQNEDSYPSLPNEDAEHGAGQGELSAGEAQAEAAIWIDGYGRSHYAMDVSASEGDNPGAQTATDIRRRLAPWHAYNADCDRTK